VPDSLGLRYLDLLVRNPGRELAAVDLVQLAAATGPAGTVSLADGLRDASGAPADDILDRQALAAYRQRQDAPAREPARSGADSQRSWR
jgi:hypothetical protein